MSWIKRDNHEGDHESRKHYPFAKWMSWLFLMIFILLLIYTYYRAEITYHGSKNSTYFKYYIVSLTGIFFWGVVLRLKETIRTNIVTVMISMVVGLYLVEAGLAFLGLGQPTTAAATAAELGVEYDQRTKLEVIEDLIAEGVDAVPAVRPSNVLNMDKELLPLGGISKRITVASNENGYFMIYPSDRYGFNNPDTEWDSEQVEWLLTGDSFTEGVAVHPGEDIGGVIRTITQESVINLGRAGNGPLMEFAELREYASLVRPTKVLWIYYENNDLIEDLQRDKTSSLLMKYMEGGFSQKLIHRQMEIDKRLEEYIAQAQAQAQAPLDKTRWMRLSSIRNLIDFDIDIDVDVDIGVDVDPLFTNILKKAKADVEAWGGELFFVYLPDYERYSNTPASHDRLYKKAEVINLVRGLNIPVIDTHQEVFVEHPDPFSLFPLRSSGHYNTYGYAKVAKAIVDGVKEYEDQNDE
jgi:hypothetical protein